MRGAFAQCSDFVGRHVARDKLSTLVSSHVQERSNSNTRWLDIQFLDDVVAVSQRGLSGNCEHRHGPPGRP